MHFRSLGGKDLPRGVDILLKDGSKWWCLNLGGSLVGELAGYPTNRRCAREIEAFVKRRKAEPVAVEGSGVVSSRHLNLIFLACASLTSFVLFYLLGFLYWRVILGKFRRAS